MHPDLKFHYGGMMLFGKGSAASKSSRHRINSRSSTKSKIVGFDNHMPGVLCKLRFLGGHGFKVNENIVYQDNQSAILMDRNGKYLCGNIIRRIDMQYFSSLTASNRRSSAYNTVPQRKWTVTASPNCCREHYYVDIGLQL